VKTSLRRKGNPAPLPKDKNGAMAPVARWWTADAEKIPGTIFSLSKEFARAQSQRLSSLERWFRLYNNSPARGVLPGNYYRTDYGVSRQNRLTINVVKSCIDTLHAKIGKNRVRTLFLTSGGSWSEQKKAKQLQKFTDGLFYQTEFYKTAATVFRDAAIFGTGIVKILEGDDCCVKIERGFVDEFFVDEVEAAYTPYPQALYQRRALPRDMLAAMYEKSDPRYKMVMEAPQAKLHASARAFGTQADLVEVIEGWHLPSKKPGDLDRKRVRAWAEKIKGGGKDARVAEEALDAYLIENSEDGRHVFTVETGVLSMEGWRRQKHCIETLHWTAPIRGFINGIGISEELMGIQYEINKILRKIQDSIDWCVPKLFVPKGSKVVLSHLDDIAGGIIEYYGSAANKPQIEAWSAVSPELFAQLDRLVRTAFESVGVSELSAQSKKPAGLESGRALETYNDIESERFIMAGRAYEDFTLACAGQSIDLAREIAEREGDYAVQAPIRRAAIEPIKWSDIDLKADAYVLQAYPVSALPTRPEGRLQFVADLMNLQFLDREDALRLLDFPDLDAVNELSEASADFCAWQIEKMIDTGLVVEPEPQQNLKYALAKANAAFLKLQTLSQKNLEGERALLNFSKLCVQRLMPPPAPMLPGMPGAAPGPGMPAMPPGAAGAMPGGVPGAAAGAAPVAGPAPVPGPVSP
jgi:hypothetical protein